MTDWELLQKYLRHQSNDAMRELVRRHSGMVHAAALRQLHDSQLADDVTQAVFLVLLRRAKNLRPGVVLGGWLFRTTMYAVADIRKQRQRRQHHEREAGRMAPHNQNSSRHIQDLQPLLNDAINKLPPADRDAIVLRYLEGCPPAEVALGLGTTENTARQRVARALDRLRKILLHSNFAVTAPLLASALESANAPPPPPALLLQLETLVHGAAPAAHIHTLVLGVLRMAQTAKYLALAGIVGAIALIGGTWFALSGSTSHPTAPDATAAPLPPVAAEVPPVSQPDNSPFNPPNDLHPDSPKGAALKAFAFAAKGDEDGFLSCLEGADADQQEVMKRYVRVTAAFTAFFHAANDKFGAAQVQSQRALARLAAFSVELTDLEQGREAIQENTATLDIGNAGPRVVQLVKVGNTWKVSAATLQGMPAAQIAQFEAQIPVIKDITAGIKAGSFATMDDVSAAMMKLLQSR